jgi:hypothetical protein
MANDSTKVSDRVVTGSENQMPAGLINEALDLAYGKNASSVSKSTSEVAKPAAPDANQLAQDLERQKQLEKAAELRAEQRVAEGMVKNPVLFAAILKSSFSEIDKDRDGYIMATEAKQYAARTDIEPVKKGVASFLDKNFDLMASSYGSRRYFAPEDLNEFRTSLRLDSCSLTGEALAEAAKWGTRTYAASKYFESDQSGLNTGVSILSSLLGSAIINSQRNRFRDDIQKLNFFELPKCN